MLIKYATVFFVYQTTATHSIKYIWYMCKLLTASLGRFLINTPKEYLTQTIVRLSMWF